MGKYKKIIELGPSSWKRKLTRTEISSIAIALNHIAEPKLQYNDYRRPNEVIFYHHKRDDVDSYLVIPYVSNGKVNPNPELPAQLILKADHTDSIDIFICVFLSYLRRTSKVSSRSPLYQENSKL